MAVGGCMQDVARINSCSTVELVFSVVHFGEQGEQRM